MSPSRPQNPNTAILRRHPGGLLCPYVYLLIYFLASVTFNVQILGPLLQTVHLLCPISLWIPWNPSVFYTQRQLIMSHLINLYSVARFQQRWWGWVPSGPQSFRVLQEWNVTLSSRMFLWNVWFCLFQRLEDRKFATRWRQQHQADWYGFSLSFLDCLLNVVLPIINIGSCPCSVSDPKSRFPYYPLYF